MAAKAGATFVSPFIGRLDDVGTDGMNLIADIVQILTTTILKRKCSPRPSAIRFTCFKQTRRPRHTIPMSVFGKLVAHPLTQSGIERFNADFAKIPQI